MPNKRNPAVEPVTVWKARPEDAQHCGQICYEAFSAINSAHGFPCDFPSSEATTGVLSMVFSAPGFYAVVAGSGGRITRYATELSFFGHATAETNLDMRSLIVSVESFGGPGILVPSRTATSCAGASEAVCESSSR